MFLPDVTKSRSPTTFAPVVSPTSCLIEPRYSTFADMTASGSGGAGGSAVADTAPTISSATPQAMAARTAAETPFEKTKPTSPNPLRATLTEWDGANPRFPPIGPQRADLE